MKDYYSILGVDKNADAKEIKSAYRNLSKKYHPDLNKGETEDKFKEIAEAYDILGNPQKREEYDNPMRSFGGFGGQQTHSDFSDIFDMFNGGNRRRTNQTENKDVKISIEIDLKTAFNGGNKQVKYNYNAKCETCDGKGGHDVDICTKCKGQGKYQTVIQTPIGNMTSERLCELCNGMGKKIKDVCKICNGKGVKRDVKNANIDIPKGTQDDIMYKYRGEGHYSEHIPGDLYIQFRIHNVDNFQRENNNLIYTLKLPFQKLILGGKVKVTSLDDKSYSVNIPKLSKNGQQLRLKNKGFERNGNTGDLIIRLEAIFPTEINKEEEKLLGELNKQDNFIYK